MKNRLFVALLVLLVWSGAIHAIPADAQGVGGGVFQSGPVTANDCTKWKSPGVIQDAGAPCGAGGGGGTVTSVSSSNTDLTVTNPTTTPVLTVNSAPILDVARTISITGDLAYTSPAFDGSSNVSAAGTLATVNASPGTFGDATHAVQITVNGKGLATAVSNVLIVPGTNTVTRSMLAQGGANTVIGNFTGVTANEADNAMPSCPDSGGNHLNYISGTGITCGTTDAHVGTVTSVAATVPAEFAISGSPITAAGTLAITKATELANLVWAGPTSGAAAQPTFRAMVAADCPASVLCPDTAGVGLQVQGAALQNNEGLTKVVTPVTTTQTLAASDCGALVTAVSAGGTLAVTLPATPPTGCEFSFIAQANGIMINPNGNSFLFSGLVFTGPFPLNLLTGASTTPSGNPYRIAWDGARWRLIGGFGPQIEAVPNGATNDPLAAHGQVYLSLTGTSLQLCPSNGPGGLIVVHFLREVPQCDGSTGFGVLLPVANTTANSLNYIYAVVLTPTVSSADNTGCNARLTVSSSANIYANDTLTVFNLTNTTEANGTWLIASVPDATHVCLNAAAFTHTGADTGATYGLGLLASTVGHVTDNTSLASGANTGVEVRSAAGGQTLVGMAFVATGPAFNDSLTKRDVLSWFNRQPKKMLVQVSGSAPNIAAGSAGSFLTTTPVIEGEFVVAGPQGQPGSVPTNSVDWRVLSNITDGGVTAVCALGATFNTTAQSANAAVTGQPEVNAGQLTAGTLAASITSVGVVAALSEGRQFIDLAGWNTAALNPCGLNGVLVPITLEAIIWQ